MGKRKSHTGPGAGYDVEPTQSYAFVAFFIACQALGGLGLLVILVTALSQRIRRYATWLNFCAAWILSCVSYLLLYVTPRVACAHVDLC